MFGESDKTKQNSMEDYRAPQFGIDFYKSGHYNMYPEGTSLIFSNLTARKSRLPGVDSVVFFGLQYFIKEYLVRQWNKEFFHRHKHIVVPEYQEFMNKTLGPGVVTTEHIAALHDLGYLPLAIKALPEGTVVPITMPMFVFYNTKPEFYWLTNYMETLMSCTTWEGITSATIARDYKKLFTQFAIETGVDLGFVPFQGHDFSMRGMSSLESAALSGSGHLLSFLGTDTIPAIRFVQQYYGAKFEDGIIGTSVPATEHSVMCAGGEFDELETIRRLIRLYPKGILSVVSDTWDYWHVLTNILPQVKNEILARDGKYVVRPDSGDPYKIIVGDFNAPVDSPEYKGTIQILYELFGGTKNSAGYVELHPCIGAIYGDSITLSLAKRILQGLKDKGFASNCIVLGIGSFTYQYNTRDTFGMAIKATYSETNGVGHNLFKSPKTDDGTKHSAKGLLAVFRDTQGRLYLKQEATWDEVNDCEFNTVYIDGMILENENLVDIRKRLKDQDAVLS